MSKRYNKLKLEGIKEIPELVSRCNYIPNFTKLQNDDRRLFSGSVHEGDLITEVHYLLTPSSYERYYKRFKSKSILNLSDNISKYFYSYKISYDNKSDNLSIISSVSKSCELLFFESKDMITYLDKLLEKVKVTNSSHDMKTLSSSFKNKDIFNKFNIKGLMIVPMVYVNDPKRRWNRSSFNKSVLKDVLKNKTTFIDMNKISNDYVFISNLDSSSYTLILQSSLPKIKNPLSDLLNLSKGTIKVKGNEVILDLHRLEFIKIMKFDSYVKSTVYLSHITADKIYEVSLTKVPGRKF